MLPTVELIFRSPSGELQRSVKPWRRPTTDTTLGEWVQDYLDDVAAGYRPEGHAAPPIPHRVRVTLQGRVLAEWPK